MHFQDWLKTATVDFARSSSRRDRRKTRTQSGQVAFAREDFICTPLVEMLENRKLLSVDPVLVADLVVGAGSSLPLSLTNVNGTLFFTANDGTYGRELWSSDGTSGGTKLVKDILTGNYGSYSPDLYPRDLTNVNGTLFFSASDNVNGIELWRSDGTSAGTTPVRDALQGSRVSFPHSLTNVNGTLFFSANDGVNGFELWQSDGTSAGTTLVKDIRTGTPGSSPHSLTNVNGTLFFSAFENTDGFQLWKSDGTFAGTTLVKGVSTGNTFLNSPTFVNVNGTLFFSASDRTNGIQLWKSDGTSAGTTLVKDIRTFGSSSPGSLTNVNGTLFFSANDGVNGTELWRSDGTSAGTTLVKDIRTEMLGSYPQSLANVSGTLFFSALDVRNGEELWQSDGTSAGTTLVKNIRRGGGDSSPGSLTNVNGTLFFTANDGTSGVELWSMQVDQILSVPKITGPEALTIAQRPAITWNNVSGADRYVVYLKNLTTAADPVLLKTVTGTSFTPTRDLGIGTYEVRVRALNAFGRTSDYSQKFSFRIATPAEFNNVERFQSSSKPSLSWKPLAGAVKYDLWIDNLSTGQQQIVRDKNVTATSWNSAIDLPMGSYRAWIRGADASGQSANWSKFADFFVLPAVLTPQGSTSDRTPTFTWTSMTGAATYELRVNRIDVATNKIVYRTGLTSSSHTPTTPLPVGTYRIWVRAVSTSSQVSRWSLPIDFSIIAVTDEPVSAPGDLLLTHLTLLDDAALQISEQPSMNAKDARAPAQTDGDRISDEDSTSYLQLTEQFPRETELTSHGSIGIGRSSIIPPSFAIDETAVDELMADITTMKLLLQI